jgi:hypothetical protein
MRRPIIADECGDGYHKACPGGSVLGRGPAAQGRANILCECSCHVEETLRTGKIVHVADRASKTGKED